MTEYDFQSLSSFDFQLLSRNLLQKHLRIVLESFGAGKDKGIDFRLRDPTGNIVVQCKHYKEYPSLLQVLRNHEVEKVRRLAPKRYILTLSASLTPARKDEIYRMFSPYCQSTSDIYGREDLNNLLGLFPDIERKHTKLWLTNTVVLEKFLNHAIWNDTALNLDRLRTRARLYVPNPSRPRANKILDEFHYCIIAGIPGIGKTMLAEILLIEHVDKLDYETIRIANDLSEIKGVKDPARKQIFYFDDFLGTTGLDKLQKNEDKRLVEFLQEVNSNDNWRFVLTTREYILNAAKLRYESLAEPVVDLNPCIIEMSDYTQPIRSRILYNHIYFSDLDDAHKRALLEDKRYEQIIHHPNYNPRIVEFMTNSNRVEGIPASSFFQAFLKSLTNPTMIWDHAFRHQLSEAGQHLILVMGTLGDEVRFADLELAFRSFYNFRQRRVGFPAGSRDFENAVKELDGNFIKTSMIGRDRIVTLHNPSLSDFLEHYFATSAGDLMDLVESAVFFDQFINLWRGRQGKTYSAFDGAGGERLLRVLDSKLMSPSCHFIRITAGKHGDYYGVRVLERSFEARLSFVFEVAGVIATVGARELRQRLLAQLEFQLLSNRGAKLQLVYLLQKLAELERGTDRVAAVLQAAKAYLLKVDDGSDFDDFEALGRFVKAFPESTKNDELHGIRAHFLNFCEGYDGSWADSPDDYRTAAEELAQVGELLDVDVSSFCDELEGRASEWEQELPTSVDDDRGDDDDDERWGRSGTEDSSQMFEELLDELDERGS